MRLHRVDAGDHGIDHRQFRLLDRGHRIVDRQSGIELPVVGKILGLASIDVVLLLGDVPVERVDVGIDLGLEGIPPALGLVPGRLDG